MDISDNQLLHQFVRENAQDAFRQLVERHTNWLYSVCLRRLHDPARAQDAAQVVFIVLAQKAPTLLNHPTLSLWLHQAAKFACNNIHRAESRRAHHESEAALMNPAASHDQWLPIAGDLEPALDSLAARDRQTILLRFYEQRSLVQIASLLHITQAAAHKRLTRALTRLRAFLLSRGHNNLSPAALPALLLSHAITPAPATLITTLAVTTAASAPIYLIPFTKGVFHMLSILKLKSAALTAVGLLLTLSLGTLAITHVLAQSASAPQPPAPSQPPAIAASSAPATAPDSQFRTIKIPNGTFSDNPNQPVPGFLVELDDSVHRTPASTAANHIKSLPDISVTLLTQAIRGVTLPAIPLRGKRVRLTAWIKTADVQNWAGLELVVYDESGRVHSFDDMVDRPLHGDSDWQKCELVADIASDATSIGISTHLDGPGEVWSDDFQLSLAPPDAATTDNQNFQSFGNYPAHYSAAPDPAEPHNGHPAICLSCLDTRPPKDAWFWYGRAERSTTKYNGHRIQMSIWIKSEKAGFSGPSLSTLGPNFKYLTRDNHVGHRPIRGTTDWQLYTVECDIPKDAQTIRLGVTLNGVGKLWIDTDSLTVDILDPTNNAP